MSAWACAIICSASVFRGMDDVDEDGVVEVEAEVDDSVEEEVVDEEEGVLDVEGDVGEGAVGGAEEATIGFFVGAGLKSTFFLGDALDVDGRDRSGEDFGVVLDGDSGSGEEDGPDPEDICRAQTGRTGKGELICKAQRQKGP